MKFIHIADLHVGQSFKSASGEKKTAAARREELFSVFNKIIYACRKREVDLLLIAGDLYEDDLVRASDINRLADGFRKIPDVKVLIAAGNHDYIYEKSFYNIIDFPENVTVFKSDSLEKVEFEDLNTCVYGLSFERKHYTEDILDIPKLDGNRTNILLLHCDTLNRESSYLPVQSSKLDESGFDYCALGHIHKSSRVAKNAFYCGSTEPLDFSEKGSHGYIYGQIEENRKTVKLIRTNQKQFVTFDLNVTGIDSLDEITEKVKKAVDGRNEGFMFRVNLKGVLSTLVRMDDVKQVLSGEFDYIEVVDHTVMDYDVKDIYLNNKNNIIGHYIDTLKDDASSRDALYLGLDALLEGGKRQ